MANTDTHPISAAASALEEALAWLATPPADDPLRELAPLRNHLSGLAGADIKPLQFLKILELFQARSALASEAVKPLLLDATLPVPKHLRTVAQGLMQIHEALAAGFLKVLRAAPPDKLLALNRPPAYLCCSGLANLAHQYEVSQLVSNQPSRDFWDRAQRLYGLIQTGLPPDAEPPAAAEEAALHMKAILALAAAQPEGFSPRETAFLAACLRRCAGAVEIRSAGDAPAAAHNCWLDAAHGFPPTAASRRLPPNSQTTLHFSCLALSRLVKTHMSHVSQGERPEKLGLPAEATLPVYRNVLARAAERWANPPKRQSRRRSQGGYRVEVCTHIGPLWQQLRHGGGVAPETAVELPASDWMILNESPSGYAIMHVAGELAGLVAGSAIGLRPSADKPWNICVVRWARSENPEHIELGIELVAPRAEAVRIARHGNDENEPPVPALLLPPLPALNRGEALLAARGHFAPGRFTLIHESAGRLQVSECTTGHLAMHTASVEIFEFERILSPA